MSVDREPSKLFKNLLDANVADDEIAELYEDLKFLFADSSFDDAVHDAVTNRGAQYIEVPEQRPN